MNAAAAVPPPLVAEPVLDGLAFPEGPRWHDGRLYFSDMHAFAVRTLDEAGHAEIVCEVPGRPSGLGWMPDGSMLVVSMRDKRILRLVDGVLLEHADLSALAGGWCNDMLVDATGRAYVGNFGWDVEGGGTPSGTGLIVVEPNGSARQLTDQLRFPNGTVLLAGGDVLVIAESGGRCLTAFDVDADGGLSGRRVWAAFEHGETGDGICLDAQGAIWVASPTTHDVLLVREGGEIVRRVVVPERSPYCVALGGADGRTLYVGAAETHEDEEAARLRTGVIAAVRVEVRGA